MSIIKILEKHSYNVTDQAGNEVNVIDRDEFEEIAKEIENLKI